MAAFMHILQRKTYKERIAPTNMDEEYRKLHRFTRANVRFLTDEFLGGETHETRGGSLTNMQRMEMTLRYLSNPGFQTGVANEVGVHQTTVSKTGTDTVFKIAAKQDKWIKFPVSRDDVFDAKTRWFDSLGFPCTVAAIDCTHIEIEKPRGTMGNEFINRKCKPTINVQATCDEKYVITSVESAWPGSVHDSRILRNSPLFGSMIKDTKNTVILGDEGYPLLPFLMTPFKNPITDEEIYYNKMHKRNRVVIENTFGQLKRRFPILKYVIRVKLENVPTFVIACCVLHNLAKYLKEEILFDEEDTITNGEVNDTHTVTESDITETQDETNQRELRLKGERRRRTIVNLLYTSRSGNE